MAKTLYDLLCVGLVGAGSVTTLFSNELLTTIGNYTFFTGIGGVLLGSIAKKCKERFWDRREVMGFEEKKKVIGELDGNIECLLEKRLNMTEEIFDLCKETERKLQLAERKIEIIESEKEGMKAKEELYEDALIQKEKKIKDLEIALDEKEKEKSLDERLLNVVESLRVEILTKNNELQSLKGACLEKERKQNEEIEELRRKNHEDNIMLNELRDENKKLRQELHEVKMEKDALRAESKSNQNLKSEETLSYKRLKLECAQKDQKIKDQKEILENLKVEKEEKSKEVEILKSKLQKKNEETNHGNTDEILLVEGLFAYMNDKVDEAKNIFEKILSSSVSNKVSALLRILLAETKAAFDNPDHLEIILDCCEAIEKGLKGRNVHLLRGEHLSELGLYDAAREDFELVLNLKKNSQDCLHKVDEVKKKVQMWKDFNHYQVLGVEQNAKKSEILKAHKNLALKYHPDRHRNKPQFLQDAFENKYKRICNAKAVLTDEEERQKYDQELQRHRLNNNQQHQRPGRQTAGNRGHNDRGPTRGFEFNNRREQRGHYSPRGATGFEFNYDRDFARDFGFKFPHGQAGFHFGNIFDLFDEYFKGNE